MLVIDKLSIKGFHRIASLYRALCHAQVEDITVILCPIHPLTIVEITIHAACADISTHNKSPLKDTRIEFC